MLRSRIPPLSMSLLCLCTVLLHSAQTFGNGWENGFNDPFKNSAGFGAQLPEIRLDMNDQKPDYVSQESPMSYRDAFQDARQLPGSPAIFNGQRNQIYSSNQNGLGGLNYGIPDLRQVSLPQLPSPQNLPAFQEPDFNLGAVGRATNFDAPQLNLGGFGGGGNGGWPGSGGMQSQSQMGPGQYFVPGMQSSPLQQMFGNRNQQQDFSANPVHFGQQQRPSFSNFQPNNQNMFSNNFNANQQQSQQQQRNQQQIFQQQQQLLNQNQNQQSSPQEQQQVSGGAQEPVETQQLLTTQEQQPEEQQPQQTPPQTQDFVATVKEVPLELNQQNNQNNGQDSDAAVTVLDGLVKGPESGLPGCGFHGMETWKKNPCETCTCEKGVTNCEKVKCTAQPERPNCVPIFHFTTCCPTYQCSNSSSRGQLPTLGPQVQEGDSCTSVGDFVPTSVSTPCLACKCNSKLLIQCKTIVCPPRPRDTSCKERLPKNPTVCCAEFDCLRPKAQAAVDSSNSDAEDDSDDTTGTTSGQNSDETAGKSQFANAGAVLSSVDVSTTASTVDKVEEVSSTPAVVEVPAVPSTTSTDEEPIVVTLEVATTTTTTSTTTTAKSTKRPLKKASSTSTISTSTTSDDSDYIDEETTLAPTSRPPGAAVVSDDNAGLPSHTKVVSETEKPAVQQEMFENQNQDFSANPVHFGQQQRPSFSNFQPIVASNKQNMFHNNFTAELPKEIRSRVPADVPENNVKSQTTTASTTRRPATTTETAKIPPAQDPSGSKGVVRDCQGGWKYPSGCDVNKDCLYIARWKQIAMDNTVRFKITTRDADRWTGIGFSKKKSLTDVDMVTGWVDKSGKIMVHDRHGDAHQPVLDKDQTISNLRGFRSGNTTTIEFSRKQKSHDTQDVFIDDESCPYFVFPVKGGAYDTFTLKIQPHEDDLELSDVGVCITRCEESTSTSEKPKKSQASGAQAKTSFKKASTQEAVLTTTTSPDEDTADDEVTTASPDKKKLVAVSGNTAGLCSTEGPLVSLNSCENCTCHKGLVHCAAISCRESFMQHFGCSPSYKVGVCCPEWICPTTTKVVEDTTTEASPTTRKTTTTATTSTATAKLVIVVPQNPDKLLILSKKAFPIGSSAEDEDSGQDTLPDRMGIVTPPPGWFPQSSANTTQSKATTTVAMVLVQPLAEVDACLNFNCGANATCVVVDAGAPSCVCKAGFEGNSKIACIKPTQRFGAQLCATVICGKNAQCFNIAGVPQCKCDNGFSGDPVVSCGVEISGGFVQPPECQLRSEIGGCQNFGMRWQFDSRISGCRQFVYSGCAGNDNNFENRQQCEQRCMPQKRFYKDKPCDTDTSLNGPPCARCDCTEQGFVACTPVSCGAAPNKDCKAVPQVGECCPKYDCSAVGAVNSSEVGVATSSRSDKCRGISCREPALKAGCIRVTVPGECCPSIQCSGTNSTLSVDQAGNNVTQTANKAPVTELPGVPCTLDDKIGSSNPCLSCQCVNGSTACSQISCPPITPLQRRRCRITQVPNQCCLKVECPPAATVAPETTTAIVAEASLAEDGADVTPAGVTKFVDQNDEQTTEEVTSTEASSTTTTTTLPTTTSTTRPPVTTRATTTTTTTTTTPKTTTTSTTRKTTQAPTTTKTTTVATTVPTVKLPVGKVGCSEMFDVGVCHATITRWYFKPATGTCESFDYSGCGGNKNRYLTKERCEAACK